MNRTSSLPIVLLLLAAPACGDDFESTPGDDSTGGTTGDPTGDPDPTTASTTINSTTSTTLPDPDDSSSGASADTSSSGGSATGTGTGDTSSDGSSSETTAADGSSSSSSSSSTGAPNLECGDGIVGGEETCDDMNADNADGCLETCQLARDCAQILAEVPAATDGTYAIDPDDLGPFAVRCDMTTDGGGWTLAARFANGDGVDNWMLDDGGWWFDLETEQGNTLSSMQVIDMISAAFWRVPATNLKVTRTDAKDASHILQTTDDCLGSDTLRGYLSSLYDGVGPWATDEVQDTCAVDLAGNYAETAGFAQAECTGDIGGPDSISFWANWHLTDSAFAADSSVMMIGGGGDDCARADHGIGITEENEATFNVFAEDEGTSEADFANDGFGTPPADYGLNLYVR